MSLRAEQIQTLNQIMAAIDEKAAQYKNERFDMRAAQSDSQRKLLVDLIASARQLAQEMNPSPAEVLDDLGRLESQLLGMR